MIHALTPYPAMKDSGVPWLGPVPEHWKIKSLGSMTKARSERSRPDLPLLSVVREKGVILRDRESKGENHNFIPDDLSNYKVVREGDLVVNKMKAWQGSMGLAPVDGIVSPAYFVFDFDIQNRLYGQALLRSRTYVDFFARASDGVRIGQWDLSIDGMKRIPVAVPTPAEQAAIVRYLDHADRRIRRTIAAKQKLIKLLQEQKQVIIHQAVTRGLDPNVKLKPSGVEWLGDVPEGWEQSSLWKMSSLRVERNPGDIPLLSIFLDRGVILYGEGGGQVHAPSLDLSNYQVVHPHDFVLNNQQAWRGSVGVSMYHGIISPAYIVLQLSDRLRPVFSNYLLRSKAIIGQFVAASKGVGDIQRQIYWPYLRTVQVIFPSLNEQKEIEEHINIETQRLSNLVQKAQQEVALLREYRTRLIADVVTGKLDVRAAALLLEAEAEVLPEDVDLLDGEDELDEGELEAVGEEAEA